MLHLVDHPLSVSRTSRRRNFGSSDGIGMHPPYSGTMAQARIFHILHRMNTCQHVLHQTEDSISEMMKPPTLETDGEDLGKARRYWLQYLQAKFAKKRLASTVQLHKNVSSSHHLETRVQGPFKGISFISSCSPCPIETRDANPNSPVSMSPRPWLSYDCHPIFECLLHERSCQT